LYLRLADGHNLDDSLPDRITYNGDPELAYSVFSILEAVEYRWTIVEVLEQPEALLNDVLMIAALHRRMRRLEDKANG
jgi:hypothetical protein